MNNVTLSKLVFIILSCTAYFGVAAQRTGISGKVFSLDSNSSIAGASVKLLNKDSLLVRSRITDSLGNFLFVDMNAGIYLLRVEALSYSAWTEKVRISKNKMYHDTVLMQPTYGDLQTVVISAKKPSIVIKTDTTEFAASSFKTNTNATVEDLFKKMPDVEVSSNGTIKVQGETITQIYVDGKPFFGNDLRAVTQNFPADMIEKIQVIDKKSDQALATKVDDGTFQRIINITLRKSVKKGIFGNGHLGYGTNERYEAKANANFFNDEKKLSVIAAANNTGKNDGSNSSSYNGIGVGENKQLKINYADKFKNNFDFSVWAGYNDDGNRTEQSIDRQNIFYDSTTSYLENNKAFSHGETLYGGLYFEYRPDTTSFLRFNESASYIRNDHSSSSIFSTVSFNEQKINDGSNDNSAMSKTPYLNGQITYNRRLSNSGRNLFLNFSNYSNNNSSTTYSSFTNHFYPADTSYLSLVRQLQFNNDRNTNIGTTISYSEPLALKHTLNFSYTYNSDNNNIPREVYDYDEQNDLFSLPNDSLNFHFYNNTKSNAASVNYNYNSRNIGFGAGMRWKQSLTESYSTGKDTTYQQSFKGILPNLSFYSVGKRDRLNVYYNTYIQAPQPYQLQPIVDNPNSIYLRQGNPSLKYAVVHVLRYNFRYYNNSKQRGFNSNASISSISNNISNSISYDDLTGKQISEPINTGAGRLWNAWFSYYAPLYFGNDKLKWNISLGTGGSKVNNFLNGETDVNRNTYMKFFFGFTYDTKDWIDLRTNVSLTKQTSKYSLQHDLNNDGYCVDISPVLTLRYGANTELNVNYDYRRTSSNVTNFNTSVNMLNVNITEYFNSGKDVWLSLRAYNVLNENVNVWQTFGENFIQYVNANGLSRYLLLTVNFRVNKIRS